MLLSILAAALTLTVGQAKHEPYAGRWIAEFKGTTFVRVELAVTNKTLGGTIGIGNFQVNAAGDISMATSVPAQQTRIFEVLVRNSTLSFSRKDGRDTDHFEMRRVGEDAELRFLPSEEDRRELAAAGVPVPNPIRLKKVLK